MKNWRKLEEIRSTLTALFIVFTNECDEIANVLREINRLEDYGLARNGIRVGYLEQMKFNLEEMFQDQKSMKGKITLNIGELSETMKETWEQMNHFGAQLHRGHHAMEKKISFLGDRIEKHLRNDIQNLNKKIDKKISTFGERIEKKIGTIQPDELETVKVMLNKTNEKIEKIHETIIDLQKKTDNSSIAVKQMKAKMDLRAIREQEERTEKVSVILTETEKPCKFPLKSDPKEFQGNIPRKVDKGPSIPRRKPKNSVFKNDKKVPMRDFTTDEEEKTPRCVYCHYHHHSNRCGHTKGSFERKKILYKDNRCHLCLAKREGRHQCTPKPCTYCKRINHHCSICIEAPIQKSEDQK